MQTRSALRTTALLMFATSAAGCATQYQTFTEKSAQPAATVSTATLPAELSTAHAGFYRAWQARDATRLRAYYAHNAVLTTWTGYFRGWQEIEARWLAPMLHKLSGFMATPTSFTQVDENEIVERGWYHMRLTEAGSERSVSGAYAQRWQRHGNARWRVVSANIAAPAEE